MCFLLSMHNITFKNKHNYSLCVENLYFMKCTTFYYNHKIILVSDSIDSNYYSFTSIFKISKLLVMFKRHLFDMEASVVSFLLKIGELQNKCLNSKFLFYCPPVFLVGRKCRTEQMKPKKSKVSSTVFQI